MKVLYGATPKNIRASSVYDLVMTPSTWYDWKERAKAIFSDFEHPEWEELPIRMRRAWQRTIDQEFMIVFSTVVQVNRVSLLVCLTPESIKIAPDPMFPPFSASSIITFMYLQWNPSMERFWTPDEKGHETIRKIEMPWW